MANGVPAVLNNQTGILGQNVKALLAAAFKPYGDTAGCTTPGVPADAPGN
jgi:hypothetical protein